jgi:hypothetical protein
MKIAACILIAWVASQVIVLLAFRALQRFNSNRFDP